MKENVFVKERTTFNQFVLDIYLFYSSDADKQLAMDLAYALRGVGLNTITPEFRDEVKLHMAWENYNYSPDEVLKVYQDIISCAVRHRYMKASQNRSLKRVK